MRKKSFDPFVKLGYFIKFGPKLEDDKAHKANIKSISIAAKKVSSGDLVIILPEGSKRKEGWYTGVGHMIDQINLKEIKNKEAYVVMAYVAGTSLFDFLRFIPGISKLMPKFKVSFSKPIAVSEIQNRISNPKKITKMLEQRYRNWKSQRC